MIDVDAESIALGDTHICSSFTENANDVRVNACCLTKQLQSLLWNKVGYDFKIIEYTMESFRSCQLQQLHSLMIDVDAESTARGDTHICLSFTEKAIAVSMNAWKCSGLDSRALGRKEMVDDDNDVHVNACCLTKQLQSLLWNKVGRDFKIIEYITESFRSYPTKQLHSLMIDVDVELIAPGDKHFCSSFTEKAIAVSMHA